MYDYVIVGCGPCGLSTAWLLTKKGHKCLLVDSAPNIGGCHRVIRCNGWFAEHGPRIYTDKYIAMNAIHNDLNIHLANAKKASDAPLSFHKLFVRAPLPNVVSEALSIFTLREMVAFARIFSANHPNITLAQYLDQNEFSPAARDYVDRLARLTDGAEAERAPLQKFASVLAKGNIYKLRRPSDEQLFRWWEIALRSAGVHIRLNTRVDGVQRASDGFVVAGAKGRNVVFCVPPESLKKIIPALSLTPAWIKEHSYLSYFSLTFHYPQNIDVTGSPALLSSPWGLAYMSVSPRVLTIVITKADGIVQRADGSQGDALAMSNAEIITEVIRQMAPLRLPMPHVTIVGNRPGDFPSFVRGLTNEVIPCQICAGMYTVGTHNGVSKYDYTSMESAIESSFAFAASVPFQTTQKGKGPSA